MRGNYVSDDAGNSERIIGAADMLLASQPEPAHQAILQQLARLTRADNGYLLQLSDEVSVVASTGRPSLVVAEFCSPERAPFDEAWACPQPMLFSRENLLVSLMHFDSSGLICNSVHLQDGTRLLLVLTRARSNPPFGTEEQKLLGDYVACAHPVLEALSTNVRLHRSLIEQERRVHDANVARRARAAFLARVSHDLRTPLSAVLGFGQLLEMEDLTDQQREYTEQIIVGGRKLLDRINEILELTLIDSDRLTLLTESVNAIETVIKCARLLLPEARDRQVNLKIRQGPDPDLLIVYADPQRLRQIITNILANAIEHCNRRGTVVAEIVALDMDTVRISVGNDGGFFDQGELLRARRPANSLALTPESREAASIGLSVARGLTEAMGGRFAMRTIPGSGGEVTIELPRRGPRLQ